MTDSSVEDSGVTNIAVILVAVKERLGDSDCGNRRETVDEDRNVRLSSFCDDPGRGSKNADNGGPTRVSSRVSGNNQRFSLVGSGNWSSWLSVRGVRVIAFDISKVLVNADA